MSVGASSTPSPAPWSEDLFEGPHQALIHAILGNISEAVCATDLTGHFIYISPVARRLFCVSEEATSLQAWAERAGLFRADGQTPLPVEELPLWRALGGEEVRNVDLFLRNPNMPQGRHIRGSFLPYRDEQGRLLGALMVARDIEEEHRSEADKHRSEAKFQQLVETAQEGVWVVDTEGRTTYANRFLAQLFGYGVEEMLGRHLFDFMDEEGQRIAAEAMEQRSQGRAGALEFKHVRKDGTPVWTHVNAVPLYDEQGRYAGSFAMLSDITRRRAAEAEVRRLNAELERRIAERTAQLEYSNRELESFAYTVAHDLRAPLRGIASFSAALLEDCPEQLDATGQDHLQRIVGGVQRMAGLIDGILALSRVNSTAMIMSACDLSAMARSILDQLQDQHPERRVQLEIQEGLVDQGDPQLLRAVLENLLCNAWKFTRERPVARIAFSATAAGQGPRVYQVRDNGAGFDMAYRDKLFGVFQRLHSQQEFEGTGVGLATSQRIIRRHGGRIWGEGQPGQGACFSFTLHEFPLPPGTTPLAQKK